MQHASSNRLDRISAAEEKLQELKHDAGESLDKGLEQIRHSSLVQKSNDKLQNAKTYLSDNDLQTMGKDLVDVIKARPVTSALVGLVIGLGIAAWIRHPNK